MQRRPRAGACRRPAAVGGGIGRVETLQQRTRPDLRALLRRVGVFPNVTADGPRLPAPSAAQSGWGSPVPVSGGLPHPSRRPPPLWPMGPIPRPRRDGRHGGLEEDTSARANVGVRGRRRLPPKPLRGRGPRLRSDLYPTLTPRPVTSGLAHTKPPGGAPR